MEKRLDYYSSSLRRSSTGMANDSKCIIKLPEKSRRIKVSEIISSKKCYSLVEFIMDFPSRYPAIEVRSVNNEVDNLIFDVYKGKILVHGMIHRSVDYKCFESTYKFKYSHTRLDALCGSIRNITMDLPFSCLADVEGVVPGDEVEVEFAGVEDSAKSAVLVNHFHIQEIKAPVFRSLKQSIIVRIDLKILREGEMTV